MPHEEMNIQQVAAYLHLDVQKVVKMASRGQIPCRKISGQFRFSKGEIDHWVETQMHELGKGRLADIEKGVSAHHGFDTSELLVSRLIPPGGVLVPLLANTRDSAVRELVDLADRADLVYTRDELLNEIQSREELCSTALFAGVAFPHPRHPLPYDIAVSFVVVGLTTRGIPFGAVNGSLTRLFFLVCCKDDRTHLHVLARLGQMLHSQQQVDALMAAETSEQLRELLLAAEKAAIEQK